MTRRPPADDTVPTGQPLSTWTTVWFNPWAHQSSEQLWAGLARTILAEISPRLHPDPDARARYWLDQNARRLDRPRLRQALVRSALSPILRVAFFALFPAIAAALIRYDRTFHLFGRDRQATQVAIALILGLLALGVLHSLTRLLFGRAEAHAPPGLLDAPVLSGVLAESPADTSLRDPLHHAKSGYLYLVQHDVERLLSDAANRGIGIIVFVDDLDRCAPQTTADMLAAVNLFLSESFPAARFVLGLDMAVVAGHIDHTLAGFAVGDSTVNVGDPSLGWTFLRKMVQLPVTLPRIPADVVDGLVEEILGAVVRVDLPRVRPAREPAEPRPAPAEPAPTPGPPREAPADEGTVEPAARAGDQALRDARVIKLERDPDVRALMLDRLHGMRQPSARETKRLLTIWQFYVRVLSYRSPLTGATELRRTCALVLLAEIVARWPASIAVLMDVRDGQRGLTRLHLAASAGDDLEWARALTKVGVDQARSKDMSKDLRAILLSENGPTLVLLADSLF